MPPEHIIIYLLSFHYFFTPFSLWLSPLLINIFLLSDADISFIFISFIIARRFFAIRH